MAFTASWIADEVLELVEVEVLDSPRSWLSDSVELLPKLDRSELIELVLIPLLRCTSAARGSVGGGLASHLIGRFEISFSLGKDFTTEATEVTDNRRREELWVNKLRNRNPYPRKQK